MSACKDTNESMEGVDTGGMHSADLDNLPRDSAIISFDSLAPSQRIPTLKVSQSPCVRRIARTRAFESQAPLAHGNPKQPTASAAPKVDDQYRDQISNLIGIPYATASHEKNAAGGHSLQRAALVTQLVPLDLSRNSHQPSGSLGDKVHSLV